MVRADRDLPFLLQYENIAHYEDGVVFILDRRVYPHTIDFLRCNTHIDTARAITDMVTQSAGPYTAASLGMAQAANECAGFNDDNWMCYMESAKNTLANARPTTKNRMSIITADCLNVALHARALGHNPVNAILEHTVNTNNNRYNRVRKAAVNLLSMLPNEATLLTHCFGETIIGMVLEEAKKLNKTLRFFCMETRPYFQGARLTASVIREAGVPVTVITDGMAAALMQKEHIDCFTTAADMITGDGHVINKIGTFQTAVIAKYMKVPYFVTGAPDYYNPTSNGVSIESRNSDEVLYAMKIRTAMEGVGGFYPSFDITPPELVSAVVTDMGIYSPYNLNDYFKVQHNPHAFLV